MQSKMRWLSVGLLALVVGMLQMPIVFAGWADVPVIGQDAPGVISQRYIVVFKKGVDEQAVARALSDAQGRGAVHHFTYHAALKGFSATLSAQALSHLKSDANVAFIEADRVQQFISDTPAAPSAATQNNPTWGLDRIDQRDLPLSKSYTYDVTGAGVSAYVIDTGIRLTHQEFGGRAYSAYTAINDGNGTNDCNGHGTHVAGTIGGSTYGVAKAVKLYAVRVLGCDGSGTTSGVIAGVDWVTQNRVKPAVANMSLGGGYSSSLDNAVRNSIASGVTYAVAAGNSNANACNYSPADVSEALSVGATDSTDTRASYSNYGSCVTLFAPGSSVTSAWNSSDSATNTISGTSMATPHTAGVAALYLQSNPSASAATVRSALINNASTGRVINAGSGSPNRLLFSLFGATSPTATPSPTAIAPTPTAIAPTPTATPSGSNPTFPSAPVIAASAGNGFVRLTWTPPNDGGSPLTSYDIFRGTSPGGESFLINISAPATSYTDTSVSNGTTYYYRMNARNVIGHSNISNEVSATPLNASPTATPTATATATATASPTATPTKTATNTPAPSKPSAPSLTGVLAHDGPRLTWTTPNSGGSPITAYNIYRGTSPGGETLLTSVAANVNGWSDFAATSGVTYYYKVSARNAVGEGLLSNEVSVKP